MTDYKHIGPPSNGTRKWIPIAQLALTAALIPFFTYIVQNIHEIEKWQAATEANRFTVYDGQKMWEEIHRIQSNIVEIRTKMPDAYPPSDFMVEWREFKRDINTRLLSIEKKIE